MHRRSGSRRAALRLAARACSTKPTLWHNPGCSKSRAALALLEERGVDFQIRAYLEDTPSFSELEQLKIKLRLPPIDWARTTDNAWIEHFDGSTIYDDLLPDDDDILRAMAKLPIMIERPILTHGEQAVVARPPERALELLDGSLQVPPTGMNPRIFAASAAARHSVVQPLPPVPVEADPLQTIGRLKSLLDAGALTQEEFDAKKTELLKRI